MYLTRDHERKSLSAEPVFSAEMFAIVALAYAAVYVVEGIGLLCKKRWAQWMTVGVTGSFVPIEVYDMARQFTAGKVVALILNVAIICDLVWHRMKERRRIPAPVGPGRRR